MYEAATRSYRRTDVLSSDPLKLVRMCYEGAIDSLKLSRDAYIARDYEAKGKALAKTLDIIHELNASLDMKKGGDVAKNLRALYLYMAQALTEADLKRDLKVFDEVLQMLGELKSAWQEIAHERSENTCRPTMEALPQAAGKAVVSSRVWSA